MQFKQLAQLDDSLTSALGFDEALSMDFRIKSTRILRVMVGVFGMLLPLLLVIFDDCEITPLESISHYYYTKSGAIFVSILTLVGIFLIFYIKNFTASTIAGISIIAVALFPTDTLANHCCIVLLDDNNWRENFHYISAVVFFFIVTIMVFRFCNQDKEETEAHLNVDYKWFYRFCGIMMSLALVFIGLRFLSKYVDLLSDYQRFYDDNNGTFWMELVALEFFGMGWLVRGYNSVSVSRYHEHLQKEMNI